MQTVAITGATSGLGEAAAIAFAKKGWRVIVIGRDRERGRDVVERAGKNAEFAAGDLFTVASVKALAAEIRRRAPELDLLVNSAGGTFGKKELTTDGLERTFALNVMAPFVLTRELEPSLAGAKGRVVNLVTGVPKNAKATLDDLLGEKSSAGVGSYTRNKLALAALTGEMQRQFDKDAITVVSLHPGIIPGTRFGQDMPAFLRSVMGFVARTFGMASTLEEAADRYVRVGTGDVERGAFYAQGKLADAPVLARDPAFARSLWTKLEELTSGVA
jgi:NAD(P)-dependent dehydrogenase (short-subunit alcohol dehydrogenase family)